MLLWQKQFLLRAPDGRSVRGHGKVQAQNEKEFLQLSIREMQKRAKRCLMCDHGKWTEIPAAGSAGTFAATCKTQDERLVFVITDETGRMLAAGETDPPLLQWQATQQEVDGWFAAERQKRRAGRRAGGADSPQSTLQPKEKTASAAPQTPVCTADGPVELELIQKEPELAVPMQANEPAVPGKDDDAHKVEEPAPAVLTELEPTDEIQIQSTGDGQKREPEIWPAVSPRQGFQTELEPKPSEQEERVQGPVLPGQWHWQRVESTATFSYLLGQLPDESGTPKAVAVAIPGEYAPAPPAYLQGFTFHRQGYWVLVQDTKTGRVMERVG